MANSPLGLVPFTALGKTWHLKFGNRARFRAEQEFGTGFVAILLNCFPDMTPEMISGEGSDGMAAALSNMASIRIGALGLLFTVGIVEPVDEDTADAITDELGPVRLAEILTEALTGASPKPRKDAGADAAAGEAPEGIGTPPG